MLNNVTNTLLLYIIIRNIKQVVVLVLVVRIIHLKTNTTHSLLLTRHVGAHDYMLSLILMVTLFNY